MRRLAFNEVLLNFMCNIISCFCGFNRTCNVLEGTHYKPHLKVMASTSLSRSSFRAISFQAIDAKLTFSWLLHLFSRKMSFQLILFLCRPIRYDREFRLQSHEMAYILRWHFRLSMLPFPLL